MEIQEPKNIYVAMSGGVDSSVAAAILARDGHNVTGVYFKPWSPNNGSYYCDWKQDRLDAIRVAAKLKIGFETWDFSNAYEEHVVRYMINSYEKGLTPNPDILCNEKIKFGLFLNRAISQGAQYIATGHYARISMRRENGEHIYYLQKGVDEKKDQSYFLCSLGQYELSKTFFPLGSIKKEQTRGIAKNLGLNTHNKKDSQGICFVGDLNMKHFLKDRIKSHAGVVRDEETGEIVGSHDGTAYYTVGQRHGLNLGVLSQTYYVTSKQPKKNEILVSAGKTFIGKKNIELSDVRLINKNMCLPKNAVVKIRYQDKDRQAKITLKPTNRILVELDHPTSGIAPGQYLAIYSRSTLLASGVIESAV